MIEAVIYKALGDPVRLEIVRRLSAGSAHTIGELSANLGISRQGARKQLQVLLEANVVHLARHGRETHVTLDTKTLEVARAFISRLENQWEKRLEALKEFAEQ
jgi:DNA-binding transcriptional ArsR family regulator